MRPRVLPFSLAALLLALPLLAGCVSLPSAEVPDPSKLLSERGYEGVIKEAFPMTMDDGVVLDTWVFRPEAPAGEKFPIILETSPYFGNSDPEISTGGQKFSLWLIDYFVPRGYAVVLQSVRGTGNSEGCFAEGGDREKKDHYDVVEALAKEPWSNGNVGMTGKSYRGTTPHMAAVLNPPSLKTIVPLAGITDWYLYTYQNGATYTGWAAFNPTYTAHVGLNGPAPERLPSDLPRWPGKVCRDAVQYNADAGVILATGDYTDFYVERNYTKDVEKMTASVYLVHGFQDWNVKPDQFGDWFSMVKSPKKAILGQWAHEMPYRADWGEFMLRWFDYWLKGIENGIMDEPMVSIEDNLGRWRFEDSWPPTRAAPLAFQLSPDGTLRTTGAGEGNLRYISSPQSEPVPGAGTTMTQLSWETEALAEPLHVAGSPDLRFTASVNAPNTQFNALLYDVNGTDWKPVTCAALDARHRENLRQGSPLTPGQEATFRFKLHALDHVFEAGHKVGLILTGSNPRWIVPEPGTEVVDLKAGPTATLTVGRLAPAPLESPQPNVIHPKDLPWTSATNTSNTDPGPACDSFLV